ncbi:MAG: glycoside hydrolase family 43 protein [Gemmatimonadaceae bacterium]
MRPARLAAVLLLMACHHAAPPSSSGDAFLFSYFTRNGEDGLHLAYSGDGVRWFPLNGGKAVVAPAVTGKGRGWQEWDSEAALMRDPSVQRGPDGMYHMVWTISWTDHAIGVAHSRDLIHWSAQAKVPVMEHEPTALNTWAPDLFWDDATKQFVIVFASAIPGRFPATDSLAQVTTRGRADHRLYYVTTTDFRTYSPTKLLYDGGFCAIDGTIAKRGDTYFLVMKDETFFPKNVRALRVASSKSATGPYGPASPPITELDTEGPSVLQGGSTSYVYFDYYTRGRYGALRTTDFTHWEPFSDSLITPRGIRHGSAFFASQPVLDGLLAMDSAPRADSGRATRILFVGNSFLHGQYQPVRSFNVANIVDENAGIPAGAPRSEGSGGPYGGIPGIFRMLTDELGLSYEVHSELASGRTLEFHFANARPVIEQAKWDVVVMHDLSTGPVPVARTGNPVRFTTYADSIERAVHRANPAAQLYLYETWSRADLTYPEKGPYHGAAIDVMAKDLHEAYATEYARNGRFRGIAPAGDAWQSAIRAGVAMADPYHPESGKINLWGADSYHPSIYGSYLNALVLVVKVTGRDPRTLGRTERAAAELGIAPDIAVTLQRIAWDESRAHRP